MIVVAPLSNDALRDWPRAHYSSLLDSLLSETDHDITLIGTSEQRQELNLYLRGRSPSRLHNTAGLWSWRQTQDRLNDADLVIANNSGVAHISAELGRPTLCLFAASHNPHEWGPRGPRVKTLYVRTACSPCGMASQWGCPFGHACMQQLTPDVVLAASKDLLSIYQ